MGRINSSSLRHAMQTLGHSSKEMLKERLRKGSRYSLTVAVHGKQVIFILFPGKLLRFAGLDPDLNSYALTSCTTGLIKSLISAPKFGMFRVQVLNVANVWIMHTEIAG